MLSLEDSIFNDILGLGEAPSGCLREKRLLQLRQVTSVEKAIQFSTGSDGDQNLKIKHLAAQLLEVTEQNKKLSDALLKVEFGASLTRPYINSTTYALLLLRSKKAKNQLLTSTESFEPPGTLASILTNFPLHGLLFYPAIER
jgi:hypothetical protein